MTLQELPDHEAQALVHDQLRSDQQRQRDEKADMRVHVEQKGHCCGAAQRLPFHHRQQQERHPGKQREEDETSAHELERIAGQMRPTQQLEERPAQDKREVLQGLERSMCGR